MSLAKFAEFREFMRGLVAPEMASPNRVQRHLVLCDVNELLRHVHENPASVIETACAT